MLAHGMGRAEIIAYFRKHYGEKKLSPTTQGLQSPGVDDAVIALLAGGGIIVLVMDRCGRAAQCPVIRPMLRLPSALTKATRRRNLTRRCASVLSASSRSASEACSIWPRY